jgi:hypothetical protein
MEDPKNAFKTVNAKTYDRNLTDKLYEISNNVTPQQLQSIITDNVKIEDEMSLGVPSSSLSSFSDLDAFKKEGDDEISIAGYGSDSETETANDTTGGESESDIIPEDPNRAVQDNNNNSGHAQPRDYVPKPPTEGKLLRKAMDDQMNNLGLHNFI